MPETFQIDSPDVVRGRRVVMATIAGTLLMLLTALVQGVQPTAIYGWVVVLPVLLPVGMAAVAAVAGVVTRLLR